MTHETTPVGAAIDTSNALFYEQPLRFESDDNICFAPTVTPPAAQLATLNAKLEAVAASEMSDLYKMVTKFNEKKIIATGRSKKGGAFQVTTPAVVEVSEGDAMASDLLALRLGIKQPIITMTPENADAIEREAIGPQCAWDGTLISK